MENINLDEIQQVYFGLKTDDVTYIDSKYGNDNYNGLSMIKPRKTLTNISTKYVYILDGGLTFNTPGLLNAKNIYFIGKNLDCYINYYPGTSNYVVDFRFTLVNLKFNFSCYSSSPAISNMYMYNVYFTNSGNSFSFYNLHRCHVNNISNYTCYLYNTYNTTYIATKCVYITGENCSVVESNEIALDELNILESFKNKGQTSIKNPDGSICNIGITGGPYYFNGFYKNFTGDNVNVEIDTEQNKTRIRIDNVNINPVLSNVGNGIKQKIFKVGENSNLSLLLEKDIPINVGQVKNKDIPLQ